MLVHDYLKYRAGQQEKGLQQKYNMVELGKMESCLQIAVRPTGGLGDYIISAKFTDELYQYGPCRIDVYCEKMEFGEAIYSPRPFIRVFPASMYENSAWQYDLAMTVEHFVHINFYNAKNCLICLRSYFGLLKRSERHGILCIYPFPGSVIARWYISDRWNCLGWTDIRN